MLDAQVEKLKMKNELLQEVVQMKATMGSVKGKLKAITPMAEQLVVAKDIEKAVRYIEKVQMGIAGVVV